MMARNGHNHLIIIFVMSIVIEYTIVFTTMVVINVHSLYDGKEWAQSCINDHVCSVR